MTISGKRCTVFAAVAIIFLGIGGCKSNNKQIRANSKLRDLSYDPNAKNVAVLFGAPNGLPGITEDLNMMQKILEAPQTGAFQVTVVNEASRDQILQATKDAAIAAGENGTIVWYFSGHGSADGGLMSTKGKLPFLDVTAAIRSVRKTPVKRMFVFLDSCFSGQHVDGTAIIKSLRAKDASDEITDEELNDLAQNQADLVADTFIDDSSEDELTVKSGAIKARRPVVRRPVPSPRATDTYAQLLVLASSSREERSIAGKNGSVFTVALFEMFSCIEASGDNLTIGKFVDGVKNEVVQTNATMTPVFRAMPNDGILNDTLLLKPRQGILPETPMEIVDIQYLAILQRSGASDYMYVYANKAVSGIEVRDTAGVWRALDLVNKAQVGWPTIGSSPVKSYWRQSNSRSVTVRAVVGGQYREATIIYQIQ